MRTLIRLNRMLLGFMPGKGTMDVIFIERRISKNEKKLFLSFVDIEKTLDRVPRRVME